MYRIYRSALSSILFLASLTAPLVYGMGEDHGSSNIDSWSSFGVPDTFLNGNPNGVQRQDRHASVRSLLGRGNGTISYAHTASSLNGIHESDDREADSNSTELLGASPRLAFTGFAASPLSNTSESLTSSNGHLSIRITQAGETPFASRQPSQADSGDYFNSNGSGSGVALHTSTNSHYIPLGTLRASQQTNLQAQNQQPQLLYPASLSSDPNARNIYYTGHRNRDSEVNIGVYIRDLETAISTHDVREMGALVFSPDIYRLSLKEIMAYRQRITALSNGLLDLHRVQDMNSQPQHQAHYEGSENAPRNRLKKTVITGLFGCGLIGLTSPIFSALFPNVCGVFSQFLYASAGCAGSYCVQGAQIGNNNLARVEMAEELNVYFDQQMAVIQEKFGKRLTDLERENEQIWFTSIISFLELVEQKKILEERLGKEQ